MYDKGDIVICVECRSVVPFGQAEEMRDGYFACSDDCKFSHELRIHRKYCIDENSEGE